MTMTSTTISVDSGRGVCYITFYVVKGLCDYHEVHVEMI